MKFDKQAALGVIGGPRQARHWLTRLFGRLPARRLQFLLDVAVLISAFYGAYLLRFDFDVPPRVLSNALLVQLPVVIFLQFLALSRAGVYSFIWRYVSLRDLYAFLGALLVAAMPMTVMRLGLPATLASLRFPLSVIIIDTVFAFGGLMGIRLLRRILYERYERRQRASLAPTGKRIPTLLVGAGRAGVVAVNEILHRDEMGMDVRGFVDHDRNKVGAVINGTKVLGAPEDLPQLVREHRIQQVVITIADPSPKAVEAIVSVCESIPVKARIIPGLGELLSGNVQFSHVRDVEIEDLLGRDPVQLDLEELGDFLTGKVVMVSGAGGSIGAELCRQACRFMPARLLLVERSEPALFQIDRELRATTSGVEIESLVADVSDERRMRSVFETHRPHLVLHAAAHKHVPLMESNPVEAIKNNVFATKLVGELAGEFAAEGFVFVSTDKAVRPTSVMGASKRVAELVVQDLNRRFATRFVAVRFGNVLGSTGSVIPIFRQQIADHGPVTVTHPEMKRYFMTIPEASQLVLQAGAMGNGGEIFVLDMGEEVRILDLAKRMIALSGLRPHDDIEIVFTGMRPGEKLFEELNTDGENISKTRHPKIFIGQIAPCPGRTLARALSGLAGGCQTYAPQVVRDELAALLPEAALSGVSEPAKPAAESTQPVAEPRPRTGSGFGAALPATPVPDAI